jgi:hypothetical protein
MPTPEQFLSKRQRYQPISFPQNVSEEEMARDWTLSDSDRAEISQYRKSSRLFVAIQLWAVRLYGRFFTQVHDLSPHIGHYLGHQIDLPPSLTIEVPGRKATYTEHRQHILTYLGFQKFDEAAHTQLASWLQQHRALRQRQKRAIDVVLETTDRLLGWPEERAFSKAELWQQIGEQVQRLTGRPADVQAARRTRLWGYPLGPLPQSP